MIKPQKFDLLAVYSGSNCFSICSLLFGNYLQNGSWDLQSTSSVAFTAMVESISNRASDSSIPVDAQQQIVQSNPTYGTMILNLP